MSIALIQLPHFYGNGLSRPPESFPLGLGYLSTILANHGIEHEAIDLWGGQLSVAEAMTRIDFGRFDFFCISAYSTQYRYLKEFSLALKERYMEVPIICGGPGPTFSYEVILGHTGVDVCVLGEGEVTVVELLRHYAAPEQVKGIAYLTEGGVRCTGQREYIKNLDELSFPNRQLFDLEKIIANAEGSRKQRGSAGPARRSADIIAGRGCPYECAYCSKTFTGVRLRSIGSIVAEVEELKRRYRVDHLQFNDELVLVNKKRTLELCAELKRLRISWSCQGRINQVDREILQAMKEAGCVEVGYGVESISPSILERMHKGIDVATVVPVIGMTKEIGITPIVQYMFGYPGETDETIAATVRFFDEIDHPYFSFTTTPLPGTELYRECLANGLIGDEEEYLLRLDSGYNKDEPLVNLTGFTDEEFLKKKKLLLLKTTHNYLKRRPAAYARFLTGYVGRKAAALLRKFRQTS